MYTSSGKIKRTKMKLFFTILFSFLFFNTVHAQSQLNNPSKIALAIHGGAGTILKKNMSPEKEKAYKQKLEEALQAGFKVLKSGGTSLDAVTAAITLMENSPLFNAGKGAVFTNEGKNEMDASIMDGETLKAGAVAGVTNIKNPILAARAVMENSPHVIMAGKGAEKFAEAQGLDMVDPSYFHTKNRFEQLQNVKESEEVELDHSGDQGYFDEGVLNKKFGTVGAVAVDKDGNIASATSTGGMTNKRYGRIGDSPIIGAGTYADNNTCAVSATGHGEYFIRAVVAYDIAALMKYKNMSLQEAADKVVMEKLVEMGADGGVIAIDQNGNIAMPFNTSGMYRGYINSDGKPTVMIYKE